MANYNLAKLKTDGNEGGYQNNPADKGNLSDLGTYKGIAPRPNPSWAGWSIIRGELKKMIPMKYGTPGYESWVKYLNKTLAADVTLQGLVDRFFKSGYWDAYRLDEIQDQAVAEWIYDHAVNGGARGIMWIQEAAGAVADGKVGPITLKAINDADPATLLQEAEDVAAFYRLDRAAADPSQIQFLPSWLRRDGVSAEEIRQVMAMAKDGLTYTEVAGLKVMIGCTT